MIADEMLKGINIKIIKFVEINENEDIKKSRSNQEAGEMSPKLVTQTNQQQNENEVNIEENRSVGESDHDSNISAGSVNEEMRILKDFKALISEKTVPKSIRVLARTMIFLGIVLIILIAVTLSLNLSKSDEISEGIYSTFQAYQRHDVMADINFNIRQLQLLAL